MSIGVGLYAPCMAMVLALGMNASCAFPAMMGSCAFLMAFGNGPKFISAGRFVQLHVGHRLSLEQPVYT